MRTRAAGRSSTEAMLLGLEARGSARRLGLARELLGRLAEHPRIWAIGLALLCTFGFFVGPPAWNQNSRLALTRAIVEHGDLVIDDWHETTGDKSYRDGHFYSDKAPGVSLLATLPYAGYYAMRRLAGADLPAVRVIPLDPAVEAAEQAPTPAERKPGDLLAYNSAQLVALWLCRMIVVSLPTLAAGALFYLVMLRELGDRTRATWVALAWLLATPALGYACGFYGHQLTADCLVASFALVVLSDGRERRPRFNRGLGLVVGSLLGWAVLAEYTAAIPIVLLLVWASWRRGWRLGAWIVVGGLPWALILAGYHTWAFGGPLKTGYDFVYLAKFAEGMAVSYGIAAPDPKVLAQLLFGSFRGLFYLSPVLLLATWGLGVRLVQTPIATPQGDSSGGSPLLRGDLLVGVAIIAWYLLLNSGYYMWSGGASLGPRHVVPMLAFLAIGLGPALARMPWATAMLGAVSCLQIVLITAAGPEAPGHGNPIWAYAVPKLFASTPQGTATTLGRLLGLPGPLSLIPLVALWWFLWPTERVPLHDRIRGAVAQPRKLNER